MLLNGLYVALGGAAGAVARWLLSGALDARAGGAFPWGTLAVNLLGCLAIGLLAALFLRSEPGALAAEQGGAIHVPEGRHLLLMVGLLGGFTTFSTFAHQTLDMLQDGAWAKAGAYVALSNALGVGLAWAGWAAGRALSS